MQVRSKPHTSNRLTTYITVGLVLGMATGCLCDTFATPAEANLDGSMMYQTFAALFVAQASGIEMSLSTQITMLLVLMVTSKGIAGVPRASLVVAAATIPSFSLPTAGLVRLVGIDAFLDMGRTLTNGIATAVVAKWENALGAPVEDDGAFRPAAISAAQAGPSGAALGASASSAVRRSGHRFGARERAETRA